MRRFLLGAAIAVTLAGAVALGGSLPAFAADTGTIAGHLSTATGEPVADVPVYVYEDDPWDIAGWALTAADGAYTVEGLPPGTYVVGFEPAGLPGQFYDNATSPSDADLVTVTAGQTTVVDEDLIPVGWLTGRLVRPDGSPVAYRPAYARTADGSNSTYGSTDEDGRYRLGALPGSYLVSFEPVDGSSQSQYIPGRLTEAGATAFPVAAGEETVADDTALATGSLTGRLTTTEGAPVADASLVVAVADDGTSTGIYANTDANGEFSVPEVLVGSYTVGFNTDTRQQWYDGAIRVEDADTVTIAAGQETRIVDSWVGTGSVAVSAVDSVTGAAIAAFCVGGQCTTGGTVTLADLPAGLHEIWLSTEDGSYFDRSANVRARANRTIAVTIKLRPAGRITTTVVDRGTGEPVEGVCVRAYKPKQVALSEGYGECSDAQGRLNVGRLTAGTYRLFVDPLGDSAYGRQWVGATGGTGDERQATQIAVTIGAVAGAPQVLLDPAGTVSGTVTSAETGQPVQGYATLLAVSPGTGASNGAAEIDAQGRYTMDRLGPYAWPVEFVSSDHAQQWSGNKPSRYTATPVTVTSGATTAYDIPLQRGTEVRGTVTLDGAAPDWGRLQAHSADTGDHTGSADFDGGQPYSMRVLGGQRVTFEYYLERDGVLHHETRVPLPPATPGGPVRYAVPVPTSGTLILDIAATTG